MDCGTSKGVYIVWILSPHIILVLARCVHYWCHMCCKIWSLLEPLDLEFKVSTVMLHGCHVCHFPLFAKTMSICDTSSGVIIKLFKRM